MTGTDENMRVLVIGAGAVGGAIGGLLHASGLPVQLVARGKHGETIRRQGLSVRLPDRDLSLSIPCLTTIDDLSPRSGDIALLSTKLQDAETALDQLLHIAGPSLPVVCAVNGIDGERWACARFNRVASMLVWIPATYLAPGEVRIYGAPCPAVLDIGLYPAGEARWIDALCGHLRAAGFDSQAQPDMQPWKRGKWITNLGGAAQALISDDWQAVARQARSEGCAVLRAAGLTHVSQQALQKRTQRVRARAIDGEHRPGGSTWQSRARGVALETPWIEGAMARLGRRIGVPTPVLQALTDAARAPRSLHAAEILGL